MPVSTRATYPDWRLGPIRGVPAANQYTIQGDRFSEALRNDWDTPLPLEDAVGNMAVIEAVFRAGASGRWETPEA